jgi:hypothetical protein
VDRYGADLPLTRQLLALRFYLHEVVQNTVNQWMSESGPVTNYATLLAWMQRLGRDESLLLITFNYDSMLDQARDVVFGTKYNKLSTYLEEPAPLVRPHGYIGWRRLVEYPPAEPSVLIDEAGHYDLTSYIDLVGEHMKLPKYRQSLSQRGERRTSSAPLLTSKDSSNYYRT